MSERIYVTCAGSISGLGVGIPNPRALYTANKAGAHPFISLREAMNWLPFDLEFEVENQLAVTMDSYIGHRTVCPVRMTDKEIQAATGITGIHDRHQLLAYHAATQVMGEGKIEIDNPERWACFVGTGGGGLNTSFKASMKMLSNRDSGRLRKLILNYLPNVCAGQIAQHFKLGGPSDTFGNACAASGAAINSLVRLIKLGEVDGGLVIGTEATICQLGIASFHDLGTLGENNTYQLGRTGFVNGEGAAALWIETESAMLKAGRFPLLEIMSYAASTDTPDKPSMVAPHTSGQSAAMRAALERADLTLEDVDVVKTHGTATSVGDPTELESLHIVGEQHDWVDMTSVIAPKSWCGHTLGASVALEMVMLIGMLEHETLLPTRNLDSFTLDPDCDIVRHPTELEALSPTATIMVNGFGFGGTNTVQIVRGCEP